MSKDEIKQESLFDLPPAWAEQWRGMPSYQQNDLESWKELKVHFKCRADLDAFAKLVGQKLTDETKSIWFPKAEITSYAGKLYESADPRNPRYPVYVISKGRWESRMTVKALERMNVPYRLVIEPQEFDQYAKVVDARRILLLPFSNLGQGSIPARNWVWEHSLSEGAKRHWILDDNIRKFCRLHNNLKVEVGDGSIFRAAEDFVDRYENVAQAGFQYWMFVPRKNPDVRPFVLNTRIYSCILNRNDLPFRWRGRYNEDTDLSLRILKAGHCTVLFYAFIADKMTTMTMKGGNTDELYKDDGRRKMAESLVEQHPDLVKVTWKWGRWQHQVDYTPFEKNRLVLRPDVVLPDGIDDYGMSLKINEPKEAS